MYENIEKYLKPAPAWFCFYSLLTSGFYFMHIFWKQFLKYVLLQFCFKKSFPRVPFRNVKGLFSSVFTSTLPPRKSGRDGFESYFTGQMLCIVALICWYLMVAKEVSHALGLHRGIMAVPSGRTKIDTRENPFTQHRHYTLKSVAKRRKFFSFVLLVYRLFAAVLLVWVGTYFLVYTVDVTELSL